jgi:hypothetical protein
MEEYRLRVLENQALRKILRTKEGERDRMKRTA